jgi:hypothetical protein
MKDMVEQVVNSRAFYDLLIRTSALRPSQQQLLRHLAVKQQLSNRPK